MWRGRYGRGQWVHIVTGQVVAEANISLEAQDFQARVADHIHSKLSESLSELQRVDPHVLRRLADSMARFAGKEEDAISAINKSEELINTVGRLAVARALEFQKLAGTDTEALKRTLNEIAREAARVVLPRRNLINAIWRFAPLAGTLTAEASKKIAKSIGLEVSSMVGDDVTRNLSQLASYDISKLTEQQAFISSVYALSDSIHRYGQFLSSEAAVGYLIGGQQSAITFAFDENKLEAVEQMFSAIGQPEFPRFLVISSIEGENRRKIINEYIRRFRIAMNTKNVPSIGGMISAPITATGTLANAIGEIEGHPQTAVAEEGYTHVATIGIADYGERTTRHQPPGLYGEVLARSRSSKRPLAEMEDKKARAIWFSKGGPIRARFTTWGKTMNKSDREIEKIMATVFARGTHGRAWMAKLATDIEWPDIGKIIGENIREQIEEFIASA